MVLQHWFEPRQVDGGKFRQVPHRRWGMAHLQWEKGTKRHMAFASAAARGLTTCRRKSAPVAVIPARLCANTTGQKKAKRRRTTGTGRMRHMKHMSRRFKNGFREGTTPPPRKKKAAGS